MNLKAGKTYARRGVGAVLILASKAQFRNKAVVLGSRSNGVTNLYYVSDGRLVSNNGFDCEDDLIVEINVFAAVEADIEAREVGTPEGYAALAGVLEKALDHAARGKGYDRHGSDDTPFIRQPSMEIARAVGTGYPVGQAMKKAAEAHRMVARGHNDAAVSELLGVINYAAIAILTIRGVR